MDETNISIHTCGVHCVKRMVFLSFLGRNVKIFTKKLCHCRQNRQQQPFYFMKIFISITCLAIESNFTIIHVIQIPSSNSGKAVSIQLLSASMLFLKGLIELEVNILYFLSEVSILFKMAHSL